MTNSKIIDVSCPTPSSEQSADLQVNSFVFNIVKVPDATWKLKGVSIPGMSISSLTQGTQGSPIHFAGTGVDFSPLICTFAVNANLTNLSLFQNWIKSLGKPNSENQFNNIGERMFAKDQYEMPRDVRLHNMLDSDSEYYGRSDASLYITSDKHSKDITAIVTFEDLFPIDVSDIDFVINADSPSYAIMSVTFAYDSYSIQHVKNNKIMID